MFCTYEIPIYLLSSKSKKQMRLLPSATKQAYLQKKRVVFTRKCGIWPVKRAYCHKGGGV